MVYIGEQAREMALPAPDISVNTSCSCGGGGGGGMAATPAGALEADKRVALHSRGRRRGGGGEGPREQTQRAHLPMTTTSSLPIAHNNPEEARRRHIPRYDHLIKLNSSESICLDK
jgi:hypothetical protein